MQIKYKFPEVCREAEGEEYGCVFACDLRHGIVIEVLSVE